MAELPSCFPVPGSDIASGTHFKVCMNDKEQFFPDGKRELVLTFLDSR